MAARKSFISLYSGAGGLDHGFAEAGFHPIWANDFDLNAVETYRANIGNHAVHGDIGARRHELVALEPDVVIGGPPCQGFSVAGRMDADDPRSEHVWTFMDLVAELQPRAFVMENVKSLAINARWSSVVEGLKAYAEELGYTPQLWVLNASHYGVPQARERMFLVGVRGTTPIKPTATTPDQPPTVRGALAKLPALGAPGNDSICPARVTPALKPVLRRSPYAGMLFNGKGRPLQLDAPAPTLPATMGGNRTPIVDQEELVGQAEENWIVGYHARLISGGRPLRRVPKRMRRLTVEEAAALQSFPDTWLFSGRQSSIFRQIGNAVPPLLAQAVAGQLSRDLARVEEAEGLTLAEVPPPSQPEPALPQAA